jgi:Cysteine-rich secretory protein family
LRTAGIASLLVIVVALFTIFSFQKGALIGSDYLASVLPSVLVDLANNDRSNGSIDGATLAMLTPNPILERAAQAKADDMARKGYFAHTSPEGIDPWHWFDEAGYDYSYAGENLAINFSESNSVNSAWMNSPLHRANILNGNYTEIGIATATGTYQGRATVFVVQEFGKPLSVVAKPGASTTTVASTKPATTTIAISPVASVKISTSTKSTASTTNATTSVLGAETETPSTSTQSAVAGTSTHYASVFEHAVTNPSKILRIIYFIIGGLVALSLILMIAIRPARKYIKHIFYGIGLLAVIIALLFCYNTQIVSGVLVG